MYIFAIIERNILKLCNLMHLFQHIKIKQEQISVQ